MGYRRAARPDSAYPAGSWDVAGRGPDPASWVYRLDLYSPSGSVTRIYPAASVLHFRYAPEPERPWTSPSPLGYARATGKLAANLELRLGEEAGSRVGYVLPVPADGGTGDEDDPLADLKQDLAALSGNTALVETTSAAWGEGRGAAPQSDWKTPTAGSESARKPGGASRRFGSEHSSGVRRSAGAGVRQIRRDEPT